MDTTIKKRNSPGRSRFLEKQRGMTMISTLVIIVFLLFQGVMALNIIPVYLTDSSVKDLVAALPDDHNAQGLTPKKLRELLIKRFRINNIYDIDDAIVVKKGRGENIVTIEYEPRGKLIANLDFIVTFSHEARVPAR